MVAFSVYIPPENKWNFRGVFGSDLNSLPFGMDKLLVLLLLVPITWGCIYTEKIRDGKTAYARKQYTVADQMLRAELKKVRTGSDRGILAYFLAETALQLGRTDQAAEYFRLSYDNGYGPEALKGLAYALKQAEQYPEAIQTFRELSIEIGSPYEYRKDITHCELAQQWKKEPYKDFRVEPLPVNSAFADYAPVLLDKNTLLFTSDRPTATGEVTYLWTGSGFTDVFAADLETGVASPWREGVNTVAHEGTLTMNAARTKAVFTRCEGGRREDAFCRLFVMERVGSGAWSPAVPVFPDLREVNVGHPALSTDGRYMLFSARSAEGWGGFDLYGSQLLDNGNWTEPSLLSRQVNTPGNEQFPVLDGDTLYFSSDFHASMGGLDIFKSYRLESGEWSPPVNMKSPVNSGADDFGFYIIHPVKGLPYGYFTSNREGGSGREDIYQFALLPPDPRREEAERKKREAEKLAAVPLQYFLDVIVLEKIFAEPGNPNSPLLGRKPLDSAQITTMVSGNDQRFFTDSTGKVRLPIQPDTRWEFIAGREGYLNNTASFNAAGLRASPTAPVLVVELEIVLDKIYRNTEIILEDIFYDLDKWDIRTDARPTLDKLANTLKINPQIRIQLGSHTDCRGNEAYNQVLSQRRAQSAIEYLIGKGIQPGRMVARGYGETEPAATCVCSRCTEEEHQQNRRTTFKIID